MTVDSGPQNSILELVLRGFAPSNRIDEYEPYEVLKYIFSVCKIWSSLGTHCTRSARNFYSSDSSFLLFLPYYMLILFIYLILHDIELLSLSQLLSILRFCYVDSHLKQPLKQPPKHPRSSPRNSSGYERCSPPKLPKERRSYNYGTRRP
jgi:hypothetical protein